MGMQAVLGKDDELKTSKADIDNESADYWGDKFKMRKSKPSPSKLKSPS